MEAGEVNSPAQGYTGSGVAEPGVCLTPTFVLLPRR